MGGGESHTIVREYGVSEHYANLCNSGIIGNDHGSVFEYKKISQLYVNIWGN